MNRRSLTLSHNPLLFKDFRLHLVIIRIIQFISISALEYKSKAAIPRNLNGPSPLLFRLQEVKVSPRVIHVPHGWWFPEQPSPDHGLWQSNANVLTRNGPPYDTAMGNCQLRALLCKVYAEE